MITGDDCRIVNDKGRLGNLEVNITAHHYKGDKEPCEAALTIKAGTMACVPWADRQKCLQEMEAVLNKYRV